MNTFQVLFKKGTEHGLIVGVSLPQDPLEELPPQAIRQLRKPEYDIAMTYNKHRRNSFVGGRIAARICLDSFNIECDSILINDDGSPKVPNAVSLSISHKQVVTRRGKSSLWPEVSYAAALTVGLCGTLEARAQTAAGGCGAPPLHACN